MLMRNAGHFRTRQMENWLLLIERNHVSCRVGVFPLRTAPFAISIYHPKVLLKGPEA